MLFCSGCFIRTALFPFTNWSQEEWANDRSPKELLGEVVGFVYAWRYVSRGVHRDADHA